MARSARKVSIAPSQIQIVHLWNRCVRRAFLCGQDPLTGKNFEHRRQWARERLEHLASIFAIDCITFAIMSNHTHQILRSRPDIARLWSEREVATRWLRISPRRDAKGNPKEPSESDINRILNSPGMIEKIRLRLSDVSWWMRYFSHYMAVRSNKEDEVSGHFWESRFGSELLADEASILTCMIYVDLNPIRAQLADSPETSDYTGAKERIDDLRISAGTTELGNEKLTLSSSQMTIHDWERVGKGNKHSGWLSPVEVHEASDPIGPDPEQGDRRASRKGAVAISLIRYLELLDWAGREIRADKRGSIPTHLLPILQRLGLTGKEVLSRMWQFAAPLDCQEGYLITASPPIVNHSASI